MKKMAPLKLDKLPVVGFLLKWFKTEEIVIDNDLFRLHHQELNLRGLNSLMSGSACRLYNGLNLCIGLDTSRLFSVVDPDQGAAGSGTV